MDRNDFLRLVAHFFDPLARVLDAPEATADLIRKLGYEPPGPVAAFGTLDAAVDTAIDLLLDLEELPEGAGADAHAQLAAQVARAVGQVVGGFQDVANTAASDAGLAALVANTDIISELPRRLMDYLVIGLLQRKFQRLHATLNLAGIVEERPFDGSADPLLSTHVRRIVHWDRIPRAVTDFVGLFKEHYEWDNPSINYRLLLDNMHRLAITFGLRVEKDTPLVSVAGKLEGAAAGAVLGVGEAAALLRLPLLPGAAPVVAELYPLFANGAADGFGIGVFLDPNAALTIPINARWRAQIGIQSDARSGFGVLLRRSRPLEFISSIYGGTGVANLPADGFDARLDFIYEAGDRLYLLGAKDTTSLSLSGLGFGFGFERDIGSGADFAGDVGLHGGALVIRTGEGDGFLKSVLPDEIRVDFDFLIGFSTRRGLYFQGSAGVETTIALHLDLGPIAIEYLTIGLGAAGEGLQMELSLTGGVALGPIQVAVDRIGMNTLLGFQGGNLGPADLAVRFKPPTGLGLAIDAGPVSGGGYISFQPDKGRYAGIVDLDVYGIGVTAIGLLATRDANGQPLPPPGFSFLMIISAEFQGVQLGFGFTLTGVGGIVGIHRTMVTDALRRGVRDGSLDHIMFPVDPVRNMPQIISDLRAFFPVANGRFLFGPMARIGWGTPTLFEAEVGILLEVPSPVVIALIGQVNVALPDKDADIVSLHLSILGIIDFGQKLLSIDASLYDSHISLFPVYGDMAMRLGWGDRPNFALAVGGLNPHFQPPPQFPSLRRATISLGLGDNPRVSLQGYMAITSNSIQFGALAELYAAAGDLNVHGWLGFDALVVFNPFHFRFDYNTGFALRWGNDPIATISITGILTGPAPYHLRGEGRISVLFFDVSIGFDVTIGQSEAIELPPRDPWDPLVEAIRDVRNWTAAMLPGMHTAVSFREQPDPDLLLVHPMGMITLRQKVVPLNRRLDKFGEFRITGAHRFDLKAVRIGSRDTEFVLIEDFFAPGQFEELSNTDKLSQPSFDRMTAGVRVGGVRIAHGANTSIRVSKVAYETTIIDDPRDRGRPVARPGLTRDVQLAQSKQGAKAHAPINATGQAKYSHPHRKPLFELVDEDYAIAGTEDTGLRLEFGTGLSRSLARRILEDHLAEHPEDHGRLQVVPLAETGGSP